MMYSEFQALFEKIAPKGAECPDIDAYNGAIEPFYMEADIDKETFVKFWLKNQAVVERVSQNITIMKNSTAVARNGIKAAQEEAAKAEAQFKETVDAMAKRQKELEEKVALLTRENEAALNENGCLQFEVENLRKRYARLVRGLCDECFSKVLFDEND